MPYLHGIVPLVGKLLFKVKDYFLYGGANNMAEGKRTRRSRSEVLQSKLEKLKEDQVKYTQKLQVIDDQIKQLEEELNEQRVDEVMAEITAQGLTIDQALEKLRS